MEAEERAKGVVYGLFAPNAPNLLAPEVFGGAGEETVRRLRALNLAHTVRPDAIVVASPHWVSRDAFLVHAGERPPCLQDYYGFPPELYAVRYDARGDPDLARFLVEEGKRRHLSVEATTSWGLDHGAWSVLYHVVPDRTIPVVPLSMTMLPPKEHIAWGDAIRAAVARSGKRIAFISTGSITHRLDMFDPSRSTTWPDGERIEKEIVELLLARRYEQLASFDRGKWAKVAPEGDLAPLFIMVGALGQEFAPRLVGYEQLFGSVGMTIVEFRLGDARGVG